MVDQQLNIKMMNTDSYRMLRLLKTAPAFVRIYQARIKLLKNLDKVVLFPEQVLGLEGQKIACVSYYSTDDNINMSISRFQQPKLVDRTGGTYTVDEIIELESTMANIAETSGVFMISTPNSNGYISFFDSSEKTTRVWFTNERAAISFAKNRIKL
jgi:hypothetical protein